MRIGLLELVGGAVDEELAQFLEARADLDVGRQRRALLLGDRPEREIDLGRGNRLGDRRDRTEQSPLELGLEPPPQRQQGRLPLPTVVDSRQPAVVELVAQLQGELKVLVAQRIRARGRVDGGDGSGRLEEAAQEQFADRAAG
jgi:hypothetical protein